MCSFPHLEPVCCSMSSSNCCFLTCIQISQETGQVVWYCHLFKNFRLLWATQSKFGIVNKAEVDVFPELACFFNDPTDVGNLISGSSAFSKSSLNIWKFTVHGLLTPGLENFDLDNFYLEMKEKNKQDLSKPNFSNMWTVNFQMFKLVLEKAEEPEI